MTKSILDAVDTFTSLINAGSLPDPIENRNGDFAFSEDLRLSGQFPKVYIDVSYDVPDEDYTFGTEPEYISGARVRVYFYTKMTKQDIYTDSEGSYRNSRLVRRFQKLIKNMVNSNLNVFHLEGIHNLRCDGTSSIIPLKDAGLYTGFVTFDMMWKENGT